jgi:putative endonuclease
LTSRRQVGQSGEQIAADYLRARGYQIVATNWRTRLGELDVIARQGSTLVFVEVRSRSTPTGGTAEESVGPDKQRRLLRVAEQYLAEHAPGANARIDVVAVSFIPGRPPDVTHIPGAVSA